MNPFIYSFMSKNFRRALQRQLEKIGCRKRNRSSGSSRTVHGSSTRTSKSQRSTPTMRRSWRGFKLIPGRPSTTSCTTNYLTDMTKQTDLDPGQIPAQPATSSV
ncbi:hypothetical protein L9F63_018043 [Diploptera punctata]|uniref:Uncharacterized protein n=1 Tax=Diploptera punctata TaxID=6984 RepID=A0AAD7ZXM0_DIPPU|nr:hypothetical protein L9F63_018043 [Diploptera punctata]